MMGKSHPGKQNPGHSLLYQITLDVPYLKFHEQLANRVLLKCLYAPISSWWCWQPHSQPAVCHPAASKPQLFLLFFFPDEVHASQCFTTCMLGEKKKQRGEDQ